MEGSRNLSRRLRPARAAMWEALRIAIENHPREDKEFRKQRDAWKEGLARSPATPSAKLVGMVIADRTINRDRKHKKFGSGWASIETLSKWTGLSVRTISSCLRDLVDDGWIVLVQGTGPGNSNIYTLRLQRTSSDRTETDFATTGCSENLQNLQGYQREIGTSELNQEHLVINSRKLQQNSTKNLPPTPIKNPSNSFTAKATSNDHYQLATAVGNGDVEVGYAILNAASEEQIEQAAIDFRTGIVTGEELKVAFGRAKSAA